MRTSFILLMVMTGLFGMPLHAQKAPKQAEIIIQTSAQCGMCKDRIEHELAFTKGVKYANLDLETKKVTVRYATSKTNPEALRLVISKIGYDADEVAADPVAYEKLPACCKKGGHDHDHDHSGHKHH
ncbi:MAG TPA: heavy-metal-associated domain-containing protein [Bacteroidales bacterium]|nr:heavy-metal-associated domain-containing protein [Bacteroidales bacterium]